jgi:3-deoxy-D-manno-octulosonic-acid transferase
MANARLTDRRFAGRRRMRPLMRDVLALIGTKLVQDNLTRDRMIALGAVPDSVVVAGLLKAAAAPLPDHPDRAAIDAAIGERPVWLAAAIEVREAPALIAAHRQVQAAVPGTLLIVAPRQPAEADAVAAVFAAAFATAPARRSDGRLPGTEDAAYLVDTMGEMGLWYRLAPISFIGHSLLVHGKPLSGKNPFEAAALGSAILYGPAIGNFAESYAALAPAHAARLVDRPDALAAQVVALILDPTARAGMADAALGVLELACAALPMTVAAILDCLPPAKLAGAGIEVHAELD